MTRKLYRWETKANASFPRLLLHRSSNPRDVNATKNKKKMNATKNLKKSVES